MRKELKQSLTPVRLTIKRQKLENIFTPPPSSKRNKVNEDTDAHALESIGDIDIYLPVERVEDPWLGEYEQLTAEMCVEECIHEELSPPSMLDDQYICPSLLGNTAIERLVMGLEETGVESFLRNDVFLTGILEPPLIDI